MSTKEPQRDDSRAQFLTVAEVAETLRLSRMTVYRLVHSGELPAMRVGRSFRVPQSAVDQLVQQSFGAPNIDDEQAAN